MHIGYAYIIICILTMLTGACWISRRLGNHDKWYDNPIMGAVALGWIASTALAWLA